jgi:hypothetical protein
MKLKYIITSISGGSIAQRWIYTIEKDDDGKRRINLLPEVAQPYVDMGWLVLDDVAPPAQIADTEKAPEYDFKGATIRNARPPVNRYSASRTLSNPAVGSDKGSLLIFSSATAVVVTLPKDWKEGEGCVIRRAGAGDVSFALETGATKVLPASRSAHTKVAEQHGEVMVRVLSNADGASAVWSIEGATA